MVPRAERMIVELQLEFIDFMPEAIPAGIEHPPQLA